MDIFLRRVTFPHQEPQAGTTGRIPEEGIVIMGYDSSMQVIASEDPPVNNMWSWKTEILMIQTMYRAKLICVFVFVAIPCMLSSHSIITPTTAHIYNL